MTEPDLQHARNPGPEAATTGELSTFNATFSHRTVSRQPGLASLPTQEAENDLLSLMTTLANLYDQDDVLEMQETKKIESGLDSDHGATSTVSTITTSSTQPSYVDSHETLRFKMEVVMKSYSANLYHIDGQPRDFQMARNFMTELRILSDFRVRRASEVVTLLGLHWDTTQLVSSSRRDMFLANQRKDIN